MIELFNGDSADQLKLLADNSIDAIVTDPPAGIGFMGKEWDKDKGGRDGWILWLTEIMLEAKRTLKPGGHGLVWALPRTSHWTATALENAGFEIRDCVYHVFGSGFPKSHNLKGNWQGWGTALKPAVECWWLVRKPLEASTVAKNVLEYGTGAINIDASRIEILDGADLARKNKIDNGMYGIGNNNNNNAQQRKEQGLPPVGRWPSHLIHDGSDEVLEHFPETAPSTIGKPRGTSKKGMFANSEFNKVGQEHNDSGSAARFFYCAKPSRAERNAKLDGFEQKLSGTYAQDEYSRKNMGSTPDAIRQPVANFHPTVKGQALMRYLITLITPPDGTVLDMFMGSGSTGVAAKALGFGFVGIELEQEYFEIAKARIDGTRVGEPLEFDKPVEINENQLDLFGLENKETETE